jgi:regulator of cell morphogenesis and NO signaling
MTVRDLVVQQPVAKRVLEQLGIDYCCGGQKPLDQALQEKGITASELNGRIALAISKAQARGESVQDWSKASNPDLITHIVDTHHAYLKTELPRLRVLFAKVMRAHGELHGTTLEPMQKEFLALAAELDTHLQKEETVVFPRIVALDAAARGKQPKPAGTAIDAPLRELLRNMIGPAPSSPA